MVQVLTNQSPSPPPRTPAPSQINSNTQLLCLVDNLIKDLDFLWQNASQTADVVFLLDHHQTSSCTTNQNILNNSPTESTTKQQLYAHLIILRTRCQNFMVPAPDGGTNHLCRKPMFGCTISKDSNNTWLIHWPNIKANILAKVLRYIYTSKLDLNMNNNDDELFEMLAIAYELGLNELIGIGEERLTTTIDVHNACFYLNETIRIGTIINEHDSHRRLIHLCMQFIRQVADQCVKTESFLNISKETMIHLLSSDQFALDEADVFRSALQWAKHQTGINKPTEHWTEDDRKRIKAQLSGVINHIRILLIDSQVFAEEVEPTGVVPIELSLERYRFAALTLNNNNNKQSSVNEQQASNNNKRLQPRNYIQINRYFPESKLLFNNVKYEHVLNEWYLESGYHQQQQDNKMVSDRQNREPTPTWKLIFRASDHEFSAEAFHNYCDGVKPTYILAMSTKGFLSGGFSDVAWSRGNKGRGCYVASERSFLFRLQTPTSQSQSDADNWSLPIKYDVKKKIFAIGHMATKGPVFGAGADFSLADSCHLNEDSYSNLPHSYDGLDANTEALFGSYYFTVLDYEVFTLNQTK